jgi:DNA polymerase III subunit alpha
MLKLKPKCKKVKDIYFPNLHSHTGIGSLGDGFGTVKHWMDSLSKRGIKHHFVTDHGTLAAIPWMYQEGRKRGITIHPGMEGYIIPEYDGYRVDNDGSRLSDDIKKGGTIVRHKYNHVVLIPINDIGWRNLIKINNESWLYGRFRGRGRFSVKTLFDNNEGLLCLSACISGIFSQVFQEYYFGYESGNKEKTLKQCRKDADILVKQYKKIFGDRLYIEIMIFHADIQVFVNTELMRLAKKHNVDIVITNDCHYPEPEHSEWREVLREFRYRSTSNKETRDSDTDNANKDFSRPEFYPRSIQDIKYTWRNAGHSKYIEWNDVVRGIENTFAVAERCTFTMDDTLKLPPFDVASHTYYKKAMKLSLPTLGNSESEKLFVYLLYRGYKKRMGIKFNKQHWSRLLKNKNVDGVCKYLKQAAYEYRVINNANFIDYFLIVEDIIRYCMQTRGRLYGQGRGSVAGSVIAWMFEISCIDPIKHGLFFERFMNPGRLAGELPDIDMDFPPSIRDEIKQYITYKYGEDRVANIGTIGVVKVRSAIQKVASAKDFLIDGKQYDFHAIQKITHAIPSSIGGGALVETLEDAVGVCANDPENIFWKFYEKHSGWLVRNLEYLQEHPVTYGRHAAGIVVSPAPINECIPIRVMDIDGDNTMIVSQWRDKDLLRLGFLKLDILGLNTLEQIEFSNKLINKRHSVTMPELGDIDRDDIKVFKRVIQTGRTMGIFQLNSTLFKRYLEELRPTKYEHIYTTTALLRPGPMRVGSPRKYVDIVHNIEHPIYLHPLMESALSGTGGLLVFQEQLMQLCVDLAGYTLEEADNMRSIVGKKKKEEMPKQRKMFIGRCKKYGGLTKEQATSVWETIETWANYGFNKAHACVYSNISMYQAFQKTYFAPEFWASKLQFGETNPEHKESVWNIRNQMLSEGYRFAPISVNTCGNIIRIDKKNRFYWRLDLIKGIGNLAAMIIRKCAPYSGPVDLLKKTSTYFKDLRLKIPGISRICPVNKRVITALIAAGAFDDVCCGGDRFNIAIEYLRFYYGNKWKDLNQYLEYSEIPEDASLTAVQKKDLEWLQGLSSPFVSVVFQQDCLRFASKPYWRMFAERIKGHRSGDVAAVVQKMNPGSHVWIYGIISNLMVRNSKRGKLLTGMISEYDGAVPFILFSEEFITNEKIYKSLSKRTTKLGWISGIVQVDKYRGGNQIIVNTIGDLANA